MKNSNIEDLAYFMKRAMRNKSQQPIFFLGAGASKTGGIPLANEIIKDILKDFSDNPKIKKAKDEDKENYYKPMEYLHPDDRNKLLNVQFHHVMVA